jgi:hypothetical protein
MVHATSWLQPSDSFSTSLRTSKRTEPLPSRSLKAAISAAGKAAPTAASGGMWSASQAENTFPLAATKGVRWEKKGSWSALGHSSLLG